MQKKSTFQKKFTAVLFGVLFICVLALGALTFIKPKHIINKGNREFEYSKKTIWNAIFDKSIYLSSKSDIYKSNIYDSTLAPRWVEFYTPNDSIEGKVIYYKPEMRYTYLLIDRKYEQVSGIKIELDSISSNKTKVSITENSKYFNIFATLYFKYFQPQTALNFEYLKLSNTLLYIDSLSKSTSEK